MKIFELVEDPQAKPTYLGQMSPVTAKSTPAPTVSPANNKTKTKPIVQKPTPELSWKDKNAIRLAVNSYYKDIKQSMKFNPQTRALWNQSNQYKDAFISTFLKLFATELHLNPADPVFDTFKPISFSEMSLKKAMNDVIVSIYKRGMEQN